MSEKSKKFQNQLDRLIKRGDTLHMAIQYECAGEEFKRNLAETIGKDKTTGYVEKLPEFTSEYQAWYSEALVLMKQVLPDRLKDFTSYFEYPRVRKDITFDNYMIRDYLQGLRVTSGNEIIADGSAAVSEFRQQLNMVKAAKATLNSALVDLTSILQADLFDSEIDSARDLAKSGFLRASGAICGVVIEKHLKQVCETHAVVIKKRNPGISDFIQALKDKDVVSVPQWRFVQHLADIRNVCDHAKGREPEEGEIDDLLLGTEKVLKTIF